MNVDELASAFKAVAGEGSRIDHARYVADPKHVGLLDEPETVRLVPPWDSAAARDLRDLIETAATVFGLDGPGTPEERWCRFVREHAPRLVATEPAELVRLVGDDGTPATVTVLTDRIHDAAQASARVVQKCRHLARAEPRSAGLVAKDLGEPPVASGTNSRGWTKGQLVKLGITTPPTFDRIRRAADVPARSKGGGGPHEEFTVDEVRRMIEKAPQAAKLTGPAVAANWRRMLGLGPRQESSSNPQ